MGCSLWACKESDMTEHVRAHACTHARTHSDCRLVGYNVLWASLLAQLVKNPPAMRETWVRFLGWEDPLEKGKTTHSSILAWKIPWTV